MLAAFALYRLLADPGSPEILFAAASDNQAGRLFEAAASYIYRSPLLQDLVTVGTVKGEIKRRDGLGIIRRLASDPKQLHGYNPSLVVADELAMWGTPNLRKGWGALTTGGVARRQAQTFSISVAGEANERQTGILGRLIDRNEAVGEIEKPHLGLTISRNHEARALVYNYSAPTSDPKNTKAVKLANPASWVTEDYLARQAINPELSTAQVLQLHACVWSASEDAWFQRDQWLPQALPEIEIKPKEKIALGFDGSQFEDATALIGSRLSDGHIFTLAVWQRPDDASIEWEINREEVDAAVTKAFDSYDVARMDCDPWEWWTEIGLWQKRYGKRVVIFRTDRRPLMAAAVDRFHTAIIAKELTHDDSSRLTEHVLNAKKSVYQKQVTLRKDRPDSSKKIDAAVAAVLAYEARAEAQQRGAGRSNELITF